MLIIQYKNILHKNEKVLQNYTVKINDRIDPSPSSSGAFDMKKILFFLIKSLINNIAASIN